MKKRVLLDEATEQLKKEFIGLDNIINEIINNITPWYLYPEFQLTPTIINLWGMTGVGKTSLVRRLLELLDIENGYFFDVGEFANETTDYKLKTDISNSIKRIKQDSPPVFIFDEFQLGRTITENGSEANRPALRVLWEFFDTGKIMLLSETYDFNKLSRLCSRLYDLHMMGVGCDNGIIYKEHEGLFFKYFPEANMSDEGTYPYGTNIKKPNRFVIPANYRYTLMDTHNTNIDVRNEITEAQLIEKIESMNMGEIIAFIKDVLMNSIKPTVYDFSTSLIFNIGNLDEVYRISNDINPDSDADFYHKHTSEITLSDIKNGLFFRYRPEQISRLGNNHIIYPSLSKKDYRDIIVLKLRALNDRLEEKFNFTCSFDDSIIDIIYKEGVFPTQGTRPIFSTIKVLIETTITNYISTNIGVVNSGATLGLSYNDKQVYIKNGNDTPFPTKVILKTENLREIDSSDKQYLCAVHEAGHAITSLYALGLVPNYVVSKAADTGIGGFCMTEYPEVSTFELLLNKLVYHLGGYAAELMCFDPSNLTTGSVNDIEKTTVLMNEIIMEYGMVTQPIKSGVLSGNNYMGIVDKDSITIVDNHKRMITKALNTAKSIIYDNSKLFFKLVDYLVHNNRIDSQGILDIMEELNLPTNFKSADNYYNFADTYRVKLMHGFDKDIVKSFDDYLS